MPNVCPPQLVHGIVGVSGISEKPGRESSNLLSLDKSYLQLPSLEDDEPLVGEVVDELMDLKQHC